MVNKLDKKAKEKIVNLSLIFLGVVLVCLIYELIAYLTSYKILPTFFELMKIAIEELIRPKILVSLGYSLLRLIIVILISSVLGFLLGNLATYLKPIETILKPLIYVLTSIPTISVILILTIYTKLTSYIIVFLITFPLIYKACLEGGKYIKEDYLKIIKMDGEYSLKNIFSIYMPLNLPYLFIGLAQATSLGIKVEIMGETFMTSTSFIGIGKEIQLASYNLEWGRLIALTLISILLMSLIEILIHFVKAFLFNRYGVKKIKVFNLK